MKRFGLYMLRWHLGGVILAPILWVILEHFKLPYLPGMLVLQTIGAFIFFPIDMWIAKQKEKKGDTTD